MRVWIGSPDLRPPPYTLHHPQGKKYGGQKQHEAHHVTRTPDGLKE